MEINNEVTLNEVIKKLSKFNYVNCIYLFGSQINKRARKDSDIDIAIITRNATKSQELNIMGHSSNNIDISLFNRLPLIIQFRVLKEGKLVFCIDEKHLNEIKMNIFRKYLDYSPFINRFYRRIIENVWFAKNWKNYFRYRKIY